jgi:two-component system, response regulator PdtaR
MVLLVDDEPRLRMYAKDALSEAHFGVVEAASADEALELLTERDDITALVTDVQMPGRLNGLALTGIVKGAHPGMPVLIVSGRPVSANVDAMRGVEFLSKPYTSEAFVDALERAIDQAGNNSLGEIQPVI